MLLLPIDILYSASLVRSSVFKPLPTHTSVAIAASTAPTRFLSLQVRLRDQALKRTAPPQPLPTPTALDRESDSRHETPATLLAVFQRTPLGRAVAGQAPQVQIHFGCAPSHPAEPPPVRSLCCRSSGCRSSSP